MPEAEERSLEPARRLPRDTVRRRLLDAAAQVFAERGFADSRLDDIARVAGFTKGAVYSNFASKQELFAAILTERSDTEHAAVRAEIQEAEDTETAISRVARTIARGVTGDPQRGQLGLECAARATRDEETRQIVASMRCAQRATAGRSFAGVASHDQVRLTVDAELAGLLVHCLRNGLAMEHLIDPESVTGPVIESALTALLTRLLSVHPTHESGAPDESFP